MSEPRAPSEFTLLIWRRAVEATREIAVLLLAFAPLDFALSDKKDAAAWMTIAGFIAVGLLMFYIAVKAEHEMHKDELKRVAEDVV